MHLDLRLIVPGPDERTTLLTPAGGLPDAMVEGDEDDAAIVAVDRFVRDLWDLRAPVLETHPRWKDVPAGEAVPTLVTTERAPRGWTPPIGLTFGPIPDAADGLPPSLVARAAELLDELRTGASPPALRPRWARPGWHARAETWMQTAAAGAGRPLTAEPRPFYLRGISALLRAPTAGPDLFLKAVFPPFHAEPVLTELLARRYPDAVPTVVAIEPDEGWLLMEDLAAPSVEDVPDADRPAALARGAATIIEIQRTFASDPEAHRELLAAGAPHRPLSGMTNGLIAALGPDGLALVEGSVDPTRARRAIEATARSIGRVAGLGFPETLIHGDFHAANAALVGDRVVIIDWSDAAIGSPLVDLVTWIAFAGDLPADGLAATDGWIDAWAGVVDTAAIRDRLDDILIIGSAYQLISYDGIGRGLEPATRYTMAGGGAHFLGRLEGVLDRREATI
ncbi:MAG TPA: phosphotransferase [Candidatus Limnocylindrales bacterium]|jgi:hypothetical protein